MLENQQAMIQARFKKRRRKQKRVGRSLLINQRIGDWMATEQVSGKKRVCLDMGLPTGKAIPYLNTVLQIKSKFCIWITYDSQSTIESSADHE